MIEVSDNGFTWCGICGRACGSGSQCECTVTDVGKENDGSESGQHRDPKNSPAIEEFYKEQDPLELEPEPDTEPEVDEEDDEIQSFKRNKKHQLESELELEPESDTEPRLDGEDHKFQSSHQNKKIRLHFDSGEPSSQSYFEEIPTHNFTMTIGTSFTGGIKSFGMSNGQMAVLHMDGGNGTVRVKLYTNDVMNITVISERSDLPIKLEVTPVGRADIPGQAAVAV